MNIAKGTSRTGVWVLVAVALGGFGVCAQVFGAGPPSPRVAATGIACSLEAKGVATQPAGMPVIFELTLTNIGNESLSYWCGGPGGYPQGTRFSADVTPVKGAGKVQTTECFNGQYVQGSGIIDEIKPGASVKIPLSIAPLVAGEYEIVFKSREEKWTDPDTNKEKTLWPAVRAAALRIAIRHDATLARTVRNEWIRGVLNGEPLASSNAAKWKTPDVTAKLVAALTGDDEKAALNAADVLWHLEPADLPRETGAATATGIERGLRPRGDAASADPDLLISLAMVAADVGSDEALAGVVKLAHSSAYEEARGTAVGYLARFRQPQVAGELEGLANDENNYVRSAAAIALADRGNAAAIPMLLKLIETTVLFRDTHVRALAHFPNDPQTVAAIRAAQKDEDQTVREAADLAWNDVKAARSKQAVPPK